MCYNDIVPIYKKNPIVGKERKSHMKKRILVLLLAVVCLVSFASCKKDTAASLYTGAMTAMEEMNAMDAKMTIKMSMKMGDETQDQDIVMNIKANGNNIYMETEDAKITYVDGVVYMNYGEDSKYKSTVSVEDFEKEYGSVSDIKFPELTEEKLKEIELVEEGEFRSFSVTIDPATMKDYMTKMIGDVMGGGDNMPEFTFSNIDMKATFDKDDNLTKVDMKFSLSADIAGQKLEMSMDMTYEFNPITTAPTITAPADAADYKEDN